MSKRQPIDDSATWLVGVIEDFINVSPENNLGSHTGEKAFDGPIVGFARGDDPLFREFKRHIGDFYWTPVEIFHLTFPQTNATPEDLSVISWILPQTNTTKSDNRKETVYPSERWARARIFGEEVNEKLRRHVVSTLEDAGYEAVAPMLSPLWERKMSERHSYASTWSERHVAYASGLGTFGLCDGLITPVGKAMRAGSVVARIKIPPTPRPYRDHRDYCLFFSQGICGRCIPRCPAGALSESGHDKEKCRNHVRPKTEEYVKANYGFDGYGCGLCQTGVPCESKIPTEDDVG
jgi:epoxyqueuosine reductase QueG